MDITCGDCGVHYRLDVALLKGEKGARIRCRKCGGRIVVRLPEESPVPPPAPAPDVPEKPPERNAPLREEPALPPPVEEASPKEPMAFDLDISGVVMSEPILPELEPALPGKIYSRVEDLFDIPPGEDAAPDTVPPEENPPEETAATEPGRKAPSRPALFTLKVLVLSVLWILLLAGGAFYFGTTKSGQDMLGTLFAGFGSSRTGSAPARPVYDIRDVKWSFEKQTASGSLFVIKGKAANFGKGPSGGIGIRVTLLGKDNQALVEKMAFAGNFLDEASLRQMDRPRIEAAMSNRFGEGNVNKEIPPGKVLPFMVIFFDPPGEIEVVMVNAIDAR